MKPIIFFSLLLIGLEVHGHHFQGLNEKPKSSSEHLLPLRKNQTTHCPKLFASYIDFAFKLYKHIASDSARRNIFFSPLSISTAFSMVALGAKSETERQLYEGLAFNLSEFRKEEIHEDFRQLIYALNDPNNTVQLAIGNSFFIQETLKLLPKFQDGVHALYNAEGLTTNFKNSTVAEKQINDYVANKTRGKIAHAIEGLDASTEMVIVNYILLKADWENPFSTLMISKEDFFVDENTIVKVDMMNRDGYYKYFHDEDLSCWVVRVPYRGDDASAWFILPDEGKLKKVESALSRTTMRKWMKSFKNDQEIRLSIPKLAVSASYDVKDLLQGMGIEDVFSDNADLSGITGEPNLKVSKVIHKAVLDINERGTEAAAVTVVEITPRGGSFPTPIILNRPFLVILIHRSTCSILFLGRILNPTEN